MKLNTIDDESLDPYITMRFGVWRCWWLLNSLKRIVDVAAQEKVDIEMLQEVLTT